MKILVLSVVIVSVAIFLGAVVGNFISEKIRDFIVNMDSSNNNKPK